jgi:predicted dehydrogenase
MSGQIDAVIVATPLTTHRDITVAALEAGYPVFCEKCMAYSTDQCKDMLHAQAKAGKVLQIGHHLRYHPLYYHAKEAFIKKGVLGDVMTVHAQWNRNAPWRRQIPADEASLDFTKWGFASPEELVNWRLYRNQSGGLLTELGSHQIDAVSWMLDEQPSAVVGTGGIDYYKDGRTLPDHVHGAFEFPSGRRFTYDSITTNAFSMFGSECYEAYMGTKGTLVLTHLYPDPASSRGWFFIEKGVQEELWMDAAHKEDVGSKKAIILDVTVTEGVRIANQPYGSLMTADGKLNKLTYQLELEEFIQSVRQNKVPTCDGRIGMHSAAHAMMANQAIEQGAKVTFPEDMFAL